MNILTGEIISRLVVEAGLRFVFLSELALLIDTVLFSENGVI
jgi:hypothetical protein